LQRDSAAVLERAHRIAMNYVEWSRAAESRTAILFARLARTCKVLLALCYVKWKFMLLDLFVRFHTAVNRRKRANVCRGTFDIQSPQMCDACLALLATRCL
jgi:hypothetical protein